jgi:hypothetical protein
MGQRVNIQYSVELDELPDEVNRLFGDAIRQLDVLAPVGGTPTLKLGTDGLDKLDDLRRKLAKIDIMLGDIQNIVEGYVRFKTQPEQPRVPDSPSEAEELEMEQIEDKIARFKEIFNAQPNQESEEPDELS